MECGDGTEISSRFYCGREKGVVGSLEARRVAEGDPEFAAISAVALRHNDINVLTTAPDRFELMHRRKPNGDFDPLP